MPLRRRLAQQAMAAAAAAPSWMSLSSSSRQKDKDEALKLVSESADTKAHAQWPKDRHGKAKESPGWGYLLTADQDKSPRRFYSTDLQLDMQKERLLHLYSLLEEDVLTSLLIKARFQ